MDEKSQLARRRRDGDTLNILRKKQMMKPNVLYRIFLLQCKNYLKK